MYEETLTQWTERIQGIPIVEPLYANDSFVCMLLACFFILSAALSSGGKMLEDILSDFFLPREYAKEGTKTTHALYMRLGMFSISFMATALFFAVYVIRSGAFEMTQGFRLTLLFFVLLVAVYALKQGLYRAVNWVFFDKMQAVAWRWSYSNWVILSGVLMFLISLSSVFFDLSAHALSILLVSYVILVEICLFFKAFHIFYAKKYGVLLLIVYLCTLELMPLLLAGKALVLYL